MARAAWLVPLLFGLLSIMLGQDTNWDLQNYHLYNPHALLTGRIGFDMAPGQWQGYFNPTIDIPYYLMVMNLPGWLCCFLMGALHGLNFPLLQAIARRILAVDKSSGMPFWLATAGVVTPAFLSELGNTMGDNLTALFVLAAILVVLQARGMGMLLLAGAIMGFGTGLKLTNANYALALCLALFAREGTWGQRFRDAFIFGLAVLGGIALSAGHWYWTMWQQFGNPLFPQFNDRFLSPMAAPIGIGDTGWLPKTVVEKLAWPFIFTLDPRRICELPLRNLMWPLLYTTGIVLLLALATGKRRLAALPRPAWLLLVFGAVSYLLWLNLFSIYRYLVPLELLSPLMCWLVVGVLLPGRRMIATACIAVCAVSILSLASWGRAGHGRAFTVEPPPIANPAQSLVYIVQAPNGWIVPFFPREVAFVSLGAGFPESEGWKQRAEAMRHARTGPFYVVLDADRADPRLQRSKAELADAARRNEEAIGRAASTLERYGLAVAGDCRPFKAMIGNYRLHQQLCEVKEKIPR
jgi:hypothetical protein